MRVDPIKNKSTVVKIINELEKESERNVILFKIGIYTGLRIKDILKLKVSYSTKNRMKEICDGK